MRKPLWALTEVNDAPIDEGLGGIVSGHTLKHLIAAAAVGVLVWAMAVRLRGTGTVPTEAVSPSGAPRASVR